MFQIEVMVRKGIDGWGSGDGSCCSVTDGKTIVHFIVTQKVSQACNVRLGLYAICHNKYSFASKKSMS